MKVSSSPYISLTLYRPLIAMALCCMSLSVMGAEPFKISLDLNQVDSFTIKVSIQTPKIELPKVRFVIPSNVPGCISELKTGRLFSDIKAFDQDGKEIYVKRNSINEFDIYPSRRLTRIEYYVHDSWHYSEPALIMRQLGTSFIKGRQYLLNFHAIAGYIEGYESNPYQVDIRRSQVLFCHTALPVSTKDHSDYVEVPNYLSLIDNPIMYSADKELGYIVGKTHYHIGFYSQNGIVGQADVEKVLKAVSEGTDAFCGGLNARDYYFLVNYIDPVLSHVVSDEEYGAVEHSGSSVYCFAETDNKAKALRDIQYTSAHELFHLFEPLNIKTDLTSKLNMRAKAQTGNLWLYEGFTEYFSLLMLYQKELITEQEFITEIRNKINLSQQFEPYSLTQQSEKCYLEGNEKAYQNFYLKGAVMAMMLDLKLIKASKGAMNLESLMVDIKNNARSNYVLKDEAVIPEMVKYSYPEIQDFFDSYIKGNQKLDYNEFLSTIGWKYQAQKLDTENMYTNATYHYSKANREFYATNITLDQIGMQEGDILVAINGKTVTRENFQCLVEKYSDRNYTHPVKFTVKRNNELLVLTGAPLTVTKNQKNMITVERKIEIDKQRFRKRFASGGLHKNKSFK